MASSVSSPPEPLTGIKLRVRGKTGEGGVVELSRGNRHGQLLIPGAIFNLLAVLMLAATSEPGPWGFMTAKELARELTRREGGDPRRPHYDSKYVIRLIFRLRRKLAG